MITSALPMRSPTPFVPLKQAAGLLEKHLLASSGLGISDSVSFLGVFAREADNTLLLSDEASEHSNHASDPATDTMALSGSVAVVMDKPRGASSALSLSDTAHASLDGYHPPGTGGGTGNQLTTTLTAGQDITKGQPVTVLTSNSATLANAYLGVIPITTKGLVVGLANETVSLGASIEICTDGVVESSDWSVATGSVNLSAGSIYFLDGAVAGKLNAVGTTTDGYMAIRVGRALDEHRMKIELTDGVVL